MTRRRLAARLLIVSITAATAASCADTVVEVESDSGEVNVDGSFETVPTATTPVVGSTTELLAEMSAGMSRLSSEIGDPGDEQATLARIEAVWAVARPDVESTQPELVGGIDTTVEMATLAVVRLRPADADKALRLLTDLVDRYNGG